MGIQINGNTNNINAGIGSLSIEDINELDIVGVATAANFKTGISNLHSVGLTLTGGQIDVGSNIKIGTAGVVTATSFSGSGANLTGIQVGGASSLSFNDNIGAYFGNSQDLKIYHDGNHSYLHNTNGNLALRSNYLSLRNAAGDENGYYHENGGTTILYYAGTPKIRTTSTGVRVIDDISIADKMFHEGDTDTAIRFPAADTITAETGGTERLRMDSSGRVMIGDTNTNNAFSGGDSLVIGNTPSGTRSGITLVSHSTTDGGIYFSTGSSNQTMGQVVYNHPDNSLRFYANNNQRLRIKSDGSVAIAGDNVNISTDTTHTVNNNEKVAIKNRYVDASTSEINLDTSGNLGQSVNLSSHSSSSNHLAMLTFDSGSLKSGIAGGRASSSNWGTELRFYTHPNATNNVHKTYERMRIDNEGSISLRYGRVNDAGHQIYRYGGRIAGTATVSVDIPVLSDGNIYWIEAFYTHHSLAYGGYLYGVYGAYSGHSGLQINNTIGSSTAGGSNVGTWSVSRGNAGQPVVVAKTAGSYGGNGYWWVHVHAGTTPNI